MSYLVAFDVATDLERGGCPLCRAAAGAGREWVRSLMRDDITNPSVRNLVDEAGGLCARHVRSAAGIAGRERDEFGLALLSELLLSVAQRRLDERSRRGRRGRLRRAPTPVGGRCPACEAETRKVIAYLEILGSAPSASEMGRSVAAGRAWLCAPHLTTALERVDEFPALRNLVGATRRRAEALASRVDDQLRHYARQPEGTRYPYTQAVADATDWLAGEPADG